MLFGNHSDGIFARFAVWQLKLIRRSDIGKVLVVTLDEKHSCHLCNSRVVDVDAYVLGSRLESV